MTHDYIHSKYKFDHFNGVAFDYYSHCECHDSLNNSDNQLIEWLNKFHISSWQACNQQTANIQTMRIFVILIAYYILHSMFDVL